MSNKYQKETDKVHKHFSIDKNETVVTHFACAHKGRMLKQGRLYITQNYLCFYAKVVGKVHKKTIKLIDVADVQKANYGVYPNAVKITTTKKKEIIFASFLMRDQAYDAIRKEWLTLKDEADVPPEKKEEEIEKRGASPSPRRNSIEPSSGSESEGKKKKKRFSLTKKHKKNKSVDNSDRSDSEIASDVSSNGGKGRRSSTSSVSSNERNSGKFSAPSTPTTPHTPASSSNSLSQSSSSSLSHSSNSVSQPSAGGSNSRSNSLSNSLSNSSSSAAPPPTSSSSSTSPTPSRGDRAQALISKGAITTEEPNAQAKRQSIESAADPTAHSTEPISSLPLWKRLCYCCF